MGLPFSNAAIPLGPIFTIDIIPAEAFGDESL
jgi:hypothetical protein